MSSSMQNDIRRFIYDQFKDKFEEMNVSYSNINNEFDLFKEGILDSFGIIEFISAIQEHFGVEIDLEDLDADQFTLIGPLCEFIVQQISTSNGLTNQYYKNDLEQLNTAVIAINNHEFVVWIADNNDKINKGLMYVNESDLLPLDNRIRGMLFDHNAEIELSYWMKNTAIPLDIAYIRADLTIAKIYTMQPFEKERIYPAGEPVRYALEVTAGTFKQLQITPENQVVFI